MVQLAFSLQEKLQEKLQELLAPHLLSSVFLKLARGGVGGAFDFPLPMRMVQKLVGPHPQGSAHLGLLLTGNLHGKLPDPRIHQTHERLVVFGVPKTAPITTSSTSHLSPNPC